MYARYHDKVKLEFIDYLTFEYQFQLYFRTFRSYGVLKSFTSHKQ